MLVRVESFPLILPSVPIICNVTNTGLSQYLAVCSSPLGAVTCEAYIAKYFEAISDSNAFASPSSTVMKAAQILNGIESTSLAGNASPFAQYLGLGLASFTTWMTLFESVIMGQPGGVQGAATAACEHLPGSEANLVVSYFGGDPPSQTVLELSTVPTTTVSVNIDFSTPSQQPCYG